MTLAQVSEALEAGLRVNKSKQYGRGMLQRQTRVLDSMQHLSEYALSAVHQKDAAIAFHCINNMGLVRHYYKPLCPDLGGI